MAKTFIAQSRGGQGVFLITFILSVIGLGISLYLTYVHYGTSSALICPANSTFNCEKVVTSPESVIFHLPVAIYGAFYFLVMAILMSPYAWRLENKYLAYLRPLISGLGMVFVIYLISQELLVIKAVCLWCTAVHVVQLLIFLITIFSFQKAGYFTKGN